MTPKLFLSYIWGKFNFCWVMHPEIIDWLVSSTTEQDCHIEHMQSGGAIIWSPERWKKEETFRRVRETQLIKKINPDIIKQQILAAVMAGDMAKASELQKGLMK